MIWVVKEPHAVSTQGINRLRDVPVGLGLTTPNDNVSRHSLSDTASLYTACPNSLRTINKSRSVTNFSSVRIYEAKCKKIHFQTLQALYSQSLG